MNKKIAIIDDEQDILNILSKFLSRSEKFNIDIFTNPQSALNIVINGDYDLILLDIMMPQMSGIEFLTEIKNSSSNAKVIMMTAYSTQDKMIDCEKLGADDYLTKPFISLRDIENKVLDQLSL